MLRVAIHSVAGELLELKAEPTVSVLKVKEAVAGLWRIPPELQQLLLGSVVLGDEDALQDHWRPEEVGDGREDLSLTMVVSLHTVFRDLAEGTRNIKKEALGTLSKLSSKGGEAAVAAAAGCLEDPDLGVRFEAIRTLTKVARRGNENAVAAVMGRLKDPGIAVRHAALWALELVAPLGDERVFDAVNERLEDHDMDMRRTAPEALVRLGGVGNDRALAGVRARLEHRDASVRRAAVVAWPQVCRRGDEHLLPALCRSLQDSDASVRKASAEALLGLGAPGAPLAAPVGKVMDHCSKDIRQAAAEVLIKLSGRGDAEEAAAAISAILARLQHPRAVVRRTALEAFARVAPSSRSDAVASIAALLQHETSGVRRTALAALEQLVVLGAEEDTLAEASGALMEAALDLVIDADPLVRAAALAALAVADGTSPRGVAAVVERLEDPVPGVRCVASWVLALWACEEDVWQKHKSDPFVRLGEEAHSCGSSGIAMLGADVFIAGVLDRLQSGERTLLRYALQVLEEVAERGDEAVVAALVECLKTSEEPVREAGLRVASRVSQAPTSNLGGPASLTELAVAHLQVLGSLGESGGDIDVVAVVAGWLEQPDARVRQAALTALLRVGGRGDAAVVSAVVQRLAHADKGIRLAALASIPEVAKKGDELAITLVMDALERASVAARSALVSALSCLLARGDARAVVLADQHLRDADWEVRSAAAELLVACCSRGDPQAVDLLRALSLHKSAHIRRSAIEALPRFVGGDAGAGGAPIVESVYGLLADPDAGVRFEAVRALAKAAHKGDASAISAAQRCLQDPAPNVRAAAAWAMEELAAVAPEATLGEQA